MKRWLSTLCIFLFCSAIVRADVTIVQTTTVEGGIAASVGQVPPTRMTTRIKGMKSRTDLDLPTGAVSMIADLVTKQVIILNHAEKTAQMSVTPAGTTTSTTTAPTITGTVKMDASVSPTGKSQVIDGFKCDEFTFTTSMAVSDVTGPNMPPDAAAMMKDLTFAMKGSMWVTKDAPGGAEYLAYQKALLSADLSTSAMAATGISMPGIDKMMKAMASVNGVAYQNEMTMTVDGSGQIAEMMRQIVGAMKITTKTNSVTTDSISDDLLKVPEGYTVVK
jgi:hypothetical protein